MRRAALGLILVLGAVACRPAPGDEARPASLDEHRLPTGRRLDPAGPALPLGSMPLALEPAPGGRHLFVLLNGYRDQGVQVVDRATGTVTQTLTLPAVFLGLAMAPDGRTLYVSGGDRDAVYRLDWDGRQLALRDSLVLEPRVPRRPSRRYPAGLALSRDGATLYVAENLADSIAVVEVATGTVRQRLGGGRYPYALAVLPDGRLFGSAWGGDAVREFVPAADGRLTPGRTIRVGRHPSALLANAAGTRLFIASASTDRVTVVDTRRRRVVTAITDTPPDGPGEGSTPSALALDATGTRLFIAESDNNAVAIVDLAAATADVPTARGEDTITGRVPVEWYPTAVFASGDTLLALTGKGRGTAPNRDGPRPGRARTDAGFTPTEYTLGQTSGSLVTTTAARLDAAALAPLSARVARANRWGTPRSRFAYPPIEHVIYIVKENRTYDQVLGDLPQGDGDTALVFFPRPVSPNHHALAERFGLFDRFFVNAEVSPDGHNWSMGAYTTDYLQKTVPSNYSGRGRTYDWEGTNRNGIVDADDDDVSEPANGYLWTLAQKAGVSFRNFGEFVVPAGRYGEPQDLPAGYRGNKPFLRAHTDPDFPGYDLDIPDQRRADVWLRALDGYVKAGRMPRLQIVRLPNDHTAGARAGAPTPRAYMADNDLALGRVIEGLSRSPFWRSTAVFVLEDDAQNGPDHVDSHRSPLLVISPWSRGGVFHRFANTTDVLATIEELLGLGTLSQFDHFGSPLREIWASTPDLRPYTALRPDVALDERNPADTPEARRSLGLRLDIEDQADEVLFNAILWRTIKGPAVPYPGTRRVSLLEVARAR